MVCRCIFIPMIIFIDHNTYDHVFANLITLILALHTQFLYFVLNCGLLHYSCNLPSVLNESKQPSLQKKQCVVFNYAPHHVRASMTSKRSGNKWARKKRKAINLLFCLASYNPHSTSWLWSALLCKRMYLNLLLILLL